MTEEFGALNPRRRAPGLVDDDFAFAESATVVEYIEERGPSGPALFARDSRPRAIQRRTVREADEDLADPGSLSRRARTAGAHSTTCGKSAPLREDAASELSAVGRTVYQFLALCPRSRRPQSGFVKGDPVGSRLSDWVARMQRLPIVERTRRRHWK